MNTIDPTNELVELASQETTELPASPTEDLKKVTEYLGLKDQVRSIEALRKEMSEHHGTYAEGDTIAILTAIATDYTATQLKEMSDTEINQLFELEEGELALSLNFDTEQEETNFKRDLMQHLRTEAEMNANLDTEMAKIENLLESFEPEFEAITREFEDIGLYLRSQLAAELALDETSPERKENLQSMIDSFDDALTLDRIFNTLQQHSLTNVLHDYKHRDQQIYKRYKRVIKALGLDTDLTVFVDLEKKFLAEKYHTYPNLFLFIVIKHYAHLKTMRRSADGMWMSRFTLNLKHFYGNRMNEKDRAVFVSGIERILDLFI